MLYKIKSMKGKPLKEEDLRGIAAFNHIILNYLKIAMRAKENQK